MSTMTTPDSPAQAKKRPSSWWFALAGVIFVVSLIPTAIAASSLIGGIRDYQVTTVQNGSEITIEDDQIAIFGRTGASTTFNSFQDANCILIDSDGTRTPAGNLVSSLTINQWQRIAVTPNFLEPGVYSLQCEVTPDVALGVAANPNIFSSVMTGLIGFFAPILGGCIALVIVIVVIVLRLQKQSTVPPRP